MTSATNPMCWDVGLALADVYREISAHVDDNWMPTREQLTH